MATGLSYYIDRMVRCLQQIASAPYTVEKVVKSGSLGKGTATDASDIDLVVFFNGLHSISDLENSRGILLWLIENQVQRTWQGPITLKKKTSRSISYRLPDGVEVDILPAFDVQREIGGPSAIYNAMDHYPGSNVQAAQQYSASLAPLQVEFVKKADCRVKEAARMLKEWKEGNHLDIRSYSLELLAIYLHRPGMSTEELFRNCMVQLTNCDNLRITFNEYYSSSDYIRQLSVPYIMDPVNPYNNTLHGVDTKAVNRAATACFQHR